jgi:hypothetical protein
MIGIADRDHSHPGFQECHHNPVQPQAITGIDLAHRILKTQFMPAGERCGPTTVSVTRFQGAGWTMTALGPAMKSVSPSGVLVISMLPLPGDAISVVGAPISWKRPPAGAATRSNFRTVPERS